MKRFIMLVSPGGAGIRTMRVPMWAVIMMALMAAVGLAGYFVPLDRLILTEQEIEQAKSLEEQNARLQNNIGVTLKMLSELREHTARLEANKEQYRDIIGLPRMASPPPPGKPAKSSSSALSSVAALRHINESERLVAQFVAAVSEGSGGIFDTIPVSRPVAEGRYVLTRRYGMDRDPFTGKQKMHYGADFAAEIGTPVFATASGTVAKVEDDPIWGRRVTISHGRGFSTVYAHLGTVSAVLGRQVKRGEVIGTVGMSGLTTGAHVHYEILRNGKQVDPEEYFFPMALAELRGEK